MSLDVKGGSNRSNAARRPWSALVSAVVLVATVGGAAAADSDEAWKTVDAYMVCGRDYVRIAPRPTPEGAEAACAKKLDAYATAMRTLALQTLLAEGRSPDKAQAFAARKEAQSRSEARSSFLTSVQQWIAERR